MREGADFSNSAPPENVLSIFYHLWRRLDHLKLGTHFLDLGGLLSELGCESLYLSLLLRDRCLQLVNFLVDGLVFGVRGRLHSTTRRWYGTLRHLQRSVRANSPAKLVV